MIQNNVSDPSYVPSHNIAANLHYWIGAFKIEFSLVFGPQVDKDLKEFQGIDWVIEKHLIHVDVRLCCLFSVNFL